ncbi:MAG TPA: anti-sigma factor [Pyrinomonadaceae bacterium]|nr:anti-sigma factor [Pyrinomonadaceae bacterium]
MSCHETRELIHGYVDGEVDLVKSMEIEEHLRDCHACTQSYKGIRSLHSVIGDGALRFDPPTNFERRLRSTLRRESEPQRRSIILRWRWVLAGTSLIAAVIVIWVVAGIFGRQSTGDLVAEEIVSSHVRSLMADHLTDVPSSDRHTVKPWFDGKLDFSPPVKDLSQQGFNLNGGRLDYIGNRRVAALVYQRGQHSINVFVWPSSGAAPVNEKASVHQGYNLIRWTNAGMTYWVVSDLNLAELQQFAQLLQGESQALS